MSGMMRCKTDEDLQVLLKNNPHLRLHQPRLIQPLGPKPQGKKHPEIKPKEEKQASEIEELMASQIRACTNLPAPIREYPHLRGTRHRLDFAWPEHRVDGRQLGLEIQGMVHRVKSRFSADLEKRAQGLLQGWLILEVGGDQVRSGKAMEWLQELFKKAVKE